MIKHETIAAAMLCVALVHTGASAQPVDAFSVQKLLQYCSSEQNQGSWLYCAGYISGIGAMMNLNGAASTDPDPSDDLKGLSICGGEQGVSFMAMIQSFKNWAQAHPEAWTQKEEFGVLAALHATWPCQ